MKDDSARAVHQKKGSSGLGEITIEIKPYLDSALRLVWLIFAESFSESGMRYKQFGWLNSTKSPFRVDME